jgi:hypothetical protein
VRCPLEDDATTHFASAMTNTRDTEAMHATVEMAALDLDLESFPTEIMPQFHFWDQAPSDPIPPLPQRIVWPATAVGDLSVSTEDTTVFELESLEAPKSSPVSTGPPERDARERFLELDEAHRVGAPGSPSKRRAGSAGVTAWLARLGVSARERPLRVAMIGLGGALIAILVLVSIQTAAVSRRLPASAAVIEATVTPMPSAVPATRAPEVLLTASKPVPTAAAARVTADRPAPIAALRQVSSPVIRAATFAHSRSGLLPATRTDSDAVTALKYLVDGRDADALRAYSALATQSLENDAYQALVRLLRRRASQSCSGTPALSASCPEVKR